MATNSNASSTGIFSLLGSGLGSGDNTPGLTNTATAVAMVLIVLLFLPWVWTARLDPREPELLKPTVPLIGHILGLIQYQAKYHQILQ